MLLEIGAALGTLGVGGVGVALVNGMFSRRRNRSGVELDEATADRARAEAVDVLTRAASVLVDPLTKQLDTVTRELAAVRAEKAEEGVRRRAAAAQHAAWDEQVADSLRALGEDVAPPPPLEDI
ncbi:hypothetical protein GV790_11140 [Nocardia cyriacigeorgica]|uniref:hypothetical protein n=1 Tax=Nocardia cyriacigeorgica TaxID=135487 RepID=UPI0013CF9DC3|nr:hypothetical protein [Nocardia cyriacigeorgica]